MTDITNLGPGERLHSALGASGTERWMNCPGSIAMSKGMPNKSSIYAMEGTAAHNLAEACLEQNLSAEVFMGQWINLDGDIFEAEPELPDGEPTVFYAGQTLSAVNPAFLIDEETVNAVNIYLETVDKYINWARDEFGVEPQLLVEKGFSLEEVYPGMFGTNDVCIFVPGHCLVIIDYKHGRGKVVEIKGNTQLRYYALGGIIELCADPAKLPHEIVTVVVQPRASHRDGPVRDATYTVEEINVEYRAELIEAAKRTEAPDAELNPGNWCFFCPGKIKCPKITSQLAEMTKVDHFDLSDDELADPMQKKHIAESAVANIIDDPELLGKFLRFIPILESVIKGVEEYALDAAMQGHTPPGQKIVRKDTKRKYRDEAAALKDLMALGFEASELCDTKLKSASALKKLGAAKWKLIDPVLTKGDHVYKPEGALTLADLSDARPPVVLDAFAELGSAVEEDFDIL